MPQSLVSDPYYTGADNEFQVITRPSIPPKPKASLIEIYRTKTASVPGVAIMSSMAKSSMSV